MKMLKVYNRLLWVLITSILISWQSTHAMEFPSITAQQLKSKLNSAEKVLLINPLSDIEFSAMHIPGSVNIPLHHIMRSKELPQDHNQLIVTYCLGPK